MEQASFQPGELEIRQDGKRRQLRGKIPYGSMATVRDRGRVRKEKFEPYSFAICNRGYRATNSFVGRSFIRPAARDARRCWWFVGFRTCGNCGRAQDRRHR